jgi:hypothetical protein
MSSGALRTMSKVMSVAPEHLDPARLDRALDRLAAHCEVVGRMTRHVEERRPQVRAQLERELGPELTRKLLAGLSAA